MTNTADTITPTMARPASRKESGLANDPKTGGTTFTPSTTKPKTNLRTAAKKVSAAPPAPAKKAAVATKVLAADRLPAGDVPRRDSDRPQGEVPAVDGRRLRQGRKAPEADRRPEGRHPGVG